MLVAQILKAKGDAVFTAAPGTLVSEAAATLAEKRIGVLVIISGDARVEGILSERDIVRSLGQRGAACLADTVDAMMTRDPVCAALSDTGEQLLTQMTEGRFRHMPVVKDGKLIGIVTQGDVVKARLEELAMENESMQGMIMGR
ncbi:CBS domain-containing protein [Roseovarius arcticus]|uniref:CBS domain-containing protein n=1 Tax=Roseovarius arcticus TaxID=2547404 RepID=UPI001110BB3B|nr:CBS domain-containing protein [Roseovarius arcticus]